MTTEPFICAGCGVLEEAREASCRTCGVAYPTPRLVGATQPRGGFWVAVRATFTCNACRFQSPLNHFQLDEGVICFKCGLEQRYEPSNWKTLVSFAQRVGDYGSGGPEGRFPDPDVEVLGQNEFGELARHGGWAIKGGWRVTPGNPLCHSCNAPRVVTERRGDLLEVGCSSCAESRTYERPPSTQRLRQLAGVLAEEHEAGRREVTLEEGHGVVVLNCPSCAAPLEGLEEATSVIACRYCGATCRISGGSHARAGHKHTPVKTWWLYFDEPCPDRKDRLNRARGARAKRERQSAQAAKQREAAIARAEQQDATPRASTPNRAFSKHPPKNKLHPALIVGIPVALALAIAVPLFLGSRTSSNGAPTTNGAGDDALRKFTFDLPLSETGELFGVPAKDDMSFDLDGAVIKRVRINRGAGSGPSYSLDLFGADQLDTDGVLQRLREVAPHRLKKSGDTYEVNTSRTLLRFDPRAMPQRRGRVEVMTWIRDESAKAGANAFWAAGQYALYGSPKPTDEQLLFVNGPPLESAAKLDLAVPIEGARKMFHANYRQSKCDTITDMTSNKTEVVCETEVNHGLVDKLKVGWNNSAQATVDSVAFMFAERQGGTDAPGATKRCLQASLGPGETQVVDHASGEGKQVWKLGEAGDRVFLEPYGVVVAGPPERDPKTVPAWPLRFPEIVKVVSSCTSNP